MKMFKSLMLIAAAAMAFTGCSNDEFDSTSASKKQTIAFSSVITRTAFGEAEGNTYPTLWTGNEKIRIGLNNNSNNGTSKEAAIATEDNVKATWTAEITDDESGEILMGPPEGTVKPFRVTDPCIWALSSIEPALFPGTNR
jgi:hypothetical protein